VGVGVRVGGAVVGVRVGVRVGVGVGGTWLTKMITFSQIGSGTCSTWRRMAVPWPPGPGMGTASDGGD